MMGVNLRGLIRDYNGYSTDVIREAIVNAFDSGANNISINTKTTTQDDNTKIKFTIKDNGEGFTQYNQKNFAMYKSENKEKENSKGSGRIAFLKYFDKVLISSVYKEDNKYKKIDFIFDDKFDFQTYVGKSKDFDIDTNLEKKLNENEEDEVYTYSELAFEVNLNSENQKMSRTNDYFKAQKIYDYIIKDLAPLFLKKVRKSEIFKIIISERKLNLEITHEDFLDYKSQEITFTTNNEDNNGQFCVEDALDKEQYNFTLYYSTFDSPDSCICYCACDRVVKNNVVRKKINIGDNNGLRVYVMSDFLESNVIGEERLQFNPKVRDLINKLNNKVTFTIKNIIANDIPEVKLYNDDMEKRIKDEMPFYFRHFKKFQETQIGKCNEDEFVRYVFKENTEYRIKKEKEIRIIFDELYRDFDYKNLDINNESKKELESKMETILNINDSLKEIDLAEYIKHRERVISLLDFYIKCNAHERYFHNLITPVKKYAGLQKVDNDYENNLWLLDDRFLCFDYIASDSHLYKLVDENLSKDQKFIRPDIVLSIAQKLQSGEYCCVIELKDNNNEESQLDNVAQLDKYVSCITRAINSNSDYETCDYLHAILITKVSKAFFGVIKRFGGGAISYKTHKLYYVSLKADEEDGVPASTVYMLDYVDVLNDAKQRNDIFMKHLMNRDTLDETNESSDDSE